MITVPLEWDHVEGESTWASWLDEPYSLLIGPVKKQPGRWSLQLCLTLSDEQGDLAGIEIEVLANTGSPEAAMLAADHMILLRWMGLMNGVQPFNPSRVLLRNPEGD